MKRFKEFLKTGNSTIYSSMVNRIEEGSKEKLERKIKKGFESIHARSFIGSFVDDQIQAHFVNDSTSYTNFLIFLSENDISVFNVNTFVDDDGLLHRVVSIMVDEE